MHDFSKALWNTSQSFHIFELSLLLRLVGSTNGVHKCNRYIQAHETYSVYLFLRTFDFNRIKSNRIKVEAKERGSREKYRKNNDKNILNRPKCWSITNGVKKVYTTEINRMFRMNLLIACATYVHQPLNDSNCNWSNIGCVCAGLCWAAMPDSFVLHWSCY